MAIANNDGADAMGWFDANKKHQEILAAKEQNIESAERTKVMQQVLAMADKINMQHASLGPRGIEASRLGYYDGVPVEELLKNLVPKHKAIFLQELAKMGSLSSGPAFPPAAPSQLPPNVGGQQAAPPEYWAPMEKLSMRMNWPYPRRDNPIGWAPPKPFNHLDIFATPEKVLIFVVHNHNHVTIEDDPSLFPSDELITKLRLMA
jgi:hypothetical protein